MKLKTIHEIFTDRIYRIPAYQRGYSWSNDKNITNLNPDKYSEVKGQLMDLWSDIENIPEDKWHYTGLLTLVKSKSKLYEDWDWLSNHEQFDIVDGQQRITTILILIAVIIEIAEDLNVRFGLYKDAEKSQYLYMSDELSNYAYIFGYDEDNPSDKFFRKYILSLDNIEDDSNESVYTENLKNAKEFFKVMVNKYLSESDKDKNEALKDLFKTVTSKLKFNVYVLPEELDEFVVFETMNNRGKPLSELEKLKNRLMYLSDKIGSESLSASQKKDLNNDINTGWITIYRELGANKNRPLGDDEFIKAHWIMYFDAYDRSKSNAHAQYLFNEYFTLDNVYSGNLTPKDIKDYVKSLQSSAVIWNKIHNPNFFTDEEESLKQAVIELHHVGFQSAFKPLVMAMLQQEYVEDYISCLKLLKSYAFKVFHVSDRRSNTGNSKLYRLSAEVHANKLTAAKVTEAIEDYISEYYKLLFFSNQIQESFESADAKGFYGWSGIRYFLYNYDEYLRLKNKNSTVSSELVWSDFQKKNNSIEHIYPQSATLSKDEYINRSENEGSLDSYTELQSKWKSFEGYTTEQKKKLCNSLGNLLAVTPSDNSSFSNDSFHHKCDQSSKGEGYRKRGYKYNTMSAQIVANESDWTPEAIKNRGLEMLKYLIEELLGEDYESIPEIERLKMLGLEFMYEA